MKTNFLQVLLLTIWVTSLPAQSEDIDLFVGADPATVDVPNVLIILDNTANWNTAFTNEMAALSSLISSLPENTFRVGLMMFTESGGGGVAGNSGEDGAYVRAAIRLFDSANKTKYQNLVNSFDKNDDKSNGGKIGKSMEEAYLYLKGGAPHAGNKKGKTDYTGNVSGGTAASNAIYALAGNALNSKNATTYNSPVVSGCAKNFIIYISNGAAQDNSSDTTQATAALSAAGGSTVTIPISPSGSQDNVADEWARFMKKSDLAVTTYTVDINKVTTGQGPGWTALLKSMANVSSGKYFDVSSSGTQIVDALKAIFSEIQSVNSVFASVSLPVSVNTQGTYLNQVYIGMFRPDQNSAPRWAGNLKQYKLGFINNTLKLQDAAGVAAINSQTGFVTECARSYWTPTAADSYWSFRPLGSCLAVANSDASNTPDGNIVEKGGQAYGLRSTTTRALNTCSPTFGSCTSLTSFTTGNAAITQALLGASSSTERDALINWARGQDVDDEHTLDSITPTSTGSTVMRPSVHGDVVHSRPVAINHGTDASPQVVVYYGGNDGILRAVNGNRTAAIGAVAAGKELWAFMPPEFYPHIKRIRNNSPAINFPGSLVVGAQAKSYGFDGPLAGYTDASNTWVFAAMRRGGRALYAFNVTSPASPSLKWKVGCPNASNDTGCTTGFSGIGQTWSSPKVVKALGYSAGSAPLLMMGGGYDSCEDADPNSCTATSKGRKIYVLDANNGSLLRTFDTDSGVIADITVVPDNSGLISYAYAADLGGNIYRISGATANTPISATPPASWTITKIAALGGSGTSARKFMFAPDVVVDGATHTLLIGSGDREKPLNSFTSAAAVANYFFVIKDKPTVVNWLSTENATCSANVICLGSLLAINTSSAPTNSELAAKPKGWYLGLASTEQVVTSAITVFGVVTFSTHQPAVAVPGQCSNLGTARVYNIEVENAASANGTGERYENIAGGGLPPSPVAGMVTLDDGTTVPFIIGADPNSPLEGGEPPTPGAASQPKAKVYWNIEQ